MAVLALAGCGSRHTAAPPPQHVLGTTVQRCAAGSLHALGSAARAYVAVASNGAVAYRTPGGVAEARFGKKNVNGYQTLFGVVGMVVDGNCAPRWYRVQLPIRPNGATGYVEASAVTLAAVDTRIEVDLSQRRLTFFQDGRPTLTATVAVGSPATPTPTGTYYVNQRLVPADPNGPYGPGAIGISAFSNVLTGWAQGGPIAIHGTDEPWSIGKDVSNGCVRLPNTTLSKLFKLAVAGTPVIIHQ